MEKELEQFQQEAQQLKEGCKGGALPFPEALRAFAVRYVEQTGKRQNGRGGYVIYLLGYTACDTGRGESQRGQGGEAIGCTYLGALYEEGLGVPKDERRAATLYEQACRAGMAEHCPKR
jgi:TPR repeat protein